MAQKETEKHETKRHHFLFHIFMMDKAENSMPQNQAKILLHYLKSVFTANAKNEKGRK